MEKFEKIIKDDTYLIPRKKIPDWELRLYLREVNYHCPICGKELQSRKQKKPSEKKFQIAHIYPNSPTNDQYKTLLGVERLGNTCESYENKIALCKDCHGTQDYHTTVNDYNYLLNQKKRYLRGTALNDATVTLGLEQEIKEVISNICKLKNKDIAELNYKAIAIANKFEPDEILIKSKISGYILTYYVYIRDLFNMMDGRNGFSFEILSGQIHACFLKMDSIETTKSEIFEHMVDWINNKTQRISRDGCEAILSFFVQNCEVFNEISK